MSASDVSPTVSALDHERLQRIASAGMRIRRVPPSAQLLAAELERARVVNPASLPPNVISMHSVFDFHDGIIEQIRRAMLVYPGEEDDGLGRIPVLSPLGAAPRAHGGCCGSSASCINPNARMRAGISTTAQRQHSRELT